MASRSEELVFKDSHHVTARVTPWIGSLVSLVMGGGLVGLPLLELVRGTTLEAKHAVAPVLGLIILSAGVRLAFGRSTFRIDMTAEVYEYAIQCLVTLRRRVGPLSDLRGVQLAQRDPNSAFDMTNSSRSTAADGYSVYLVGPFGPMRTFWSRSHAESLAAAEALAHRLNLPLVDHTHADRITRRECSVGERDAQTISSTPACRDIQSDGERHALRPVIQGDQIAWQLRSLRKALRYATVSAALVAFVCVGALSAAPSGLGLAALVAAPVFVWLFVLGVMSASRQWLVVRPRELRVVNSLFGEVTKQGTGAIGAPELERIDVFFSAGPFGRHFGLRARGTGDIVVTGRHKELAFGSHLPHRDKLWIKSVIEQVVGVGEPARSKTTNKPAKRRRPPP